MSNITPHKPSFVFGYWRPWKEDSNFIDSYFDYVKDKSLVKYGADTVGKYISQASAEQVDAINKLGQAIGQGMNVLSTQLTNIDSSLDFINRTLYLQIDQQRITNLLLEDIKELMWVPDSEKVRQNCIELGFKFFTQAQIDEDLLEDALQELRKAEELKKQDYFVLYRLGLIYLYSAKHIDVSRALQYFESAAKYSSIEIDPKAFYIANKLSGKIISCVEPIDKIQIKHFGGKKLEVVKLAKEYLNCGLKEAKDLVDSIEISPLFLTSQQIKGRNMDIFLKELQDCGAVVEYTRATPKNAIRVSNDKSGIEEFVSEAYNNAAFASYILGYDEKAIKYQTKVVNYQNTPIARFTLAKYQVRNGNTDEAIKNLDIAINESPELVLGVFKEIEFVNDSTIVNLIAEKNKSIDEKINEEILKWEKIESTQTSHILKELAELSEQPYVTKVLQTKSIEKQANVINESIKNVKSEIDSYIIGIENSAFCSFDDKTVQLKIDELLKAKKLPIENMQYVFNIIKNEVDDDILKIGSKYAGGIVFFIDETGNHGLVCADKDFGKASWGGEGKIGANEDGISNGFGMRNTRKIVEHASWDVKRVFFITTKNPAPTAARLCLESCYNGFTDWYLPTISELELIYKNLHKNHIGKFCNEEYWSSTDSSQNAWRLDFSSGHRWNNYHVGNFEYKKYQIKDFLNVSKSQTLNFLPVRAF